MTYHSINTQSISRHEIGYRDLHRLHQHPLELPHNTVNFASLYMQKMSINVLKKKYLSI